MATYQYHCPKCTYIGRFVVTELVGNKIECSSCGEQSRNKKAKLEQVLKKTCYSCNYHKNCRCKFLPPTYTDGKKYGSYPRVWGDGWCGHWTEANKQDEEEIFRRV